VGTTTNPNANGAFITTLLTGVRLEEITDGTANTLLIGEKHVPPGQYGKEPHDNTIYSAATFTAMARTAGAAGLALSPNDSAANYWTFGGPHNGVVQFAFCDGHVQSLRTSIPGSVLSLLADKSDGMVVPNYD
jgi:prepilin-type processing-associated H-X9-DG protein